MKVLSVSVVCLFFEVNSKTIQECKCNLRSARRKVQIQRGAHRGAGEERHRFPLHSRKMLGVFSPHLPCEMAEANFRQFQWFSPRFLSIFNRFRWISCHFSQFQSILVSFNQFQSVWLGQKRRNWLTTGRWGKQHLKNGPKSNIR